MFRGLRTVFTRSEDDKLAALLDAQRAEQRNAESLLSRLREGRDALMARGYDETRHRIETLDREIAAASERIRRALKLQAASLLRLAGRPEVTAGR